MRRLAQLWEERRDDLLYWAGALVILSVGALWWGLQLRLGVPFVYHPDEPACLARALIMLDSGDANPRWFHYPTLYMYLQAAVSALVHALGGVPIGPGAEVLFEGARPEAVPFYVAGRVLTLLFALGTTCLLMAITRRIASSALALLAGAIFVTSGLVLRSAIYVTVDMPLTFFVTLSSFLLIRVVSANVDPRRPLSWAAVVVCASLGAGMKYNGALVLLVFAGTFLAVRGLSRRNVLELFAHALLSIAVFVLTTPYAVLDWSGFWDREDGLTAELIHYTSGHPGADQGSSIVKILYTLLASVGPLVFLAPLALGMLVVGSVPRATKAAAGVLLAVLVTLALPVALAKVFFERNCLPFVPPAIALSCLVIRRVADWASGLALTTQGRRWAVLVTGLAAAAVQANSAYDMLKPHAAALRLPDTRTVAYQWADKNLPNGARILREAFTPHLHLNSRFVVENRFSLAKASRNELENEFDYAVTSSNVWLAYGDLQRTAYARLFAKAPVFEVQQVGNAPSIRIHKLMVPAIERRTVFRVSEDSGFSDIHPVADVKIRQRASNGAGPLVLLSTGPDPSILLPELPELPTGRFLLRVSLTSPAETMLQVFYTVPSAPHFNEQNSFKRKVVRGKNEVEIRMGPAQLQGRIRLDPGDRRGRYLLHAVALLEIAS